MKPIDIAETAKLIFDNTYLVRIPEYAARTTEYMREYGRYITGIREIDGPAAYNPFTTYLNIARMAEHYHDGVTVAIVNYPDLKTIYDSITDHLAAWKYHTTHVINQSPAPVQDLLILDEFAAAVFQYAKVGMSDAAIRSQFAESLERMAIVKHDDFLKPYVPTTVPGPAKQPSDFNRFSSFSEPTQPQTSQATRESYHDYFKIRQVIERQRS